MAFSILISSKLLLVVFMILFLHLSSALQFSSRWIIQGHSSRSSSHLYLSDEAVTGTQIRGLPPVSTTDMEELRGIYLQMTNAIESDNSELALAVVSKNVGFVFQRNIPKLTQMMLQQYPALRQSKTTLQAYYLILNAMEVMAQEKKKMIMANQELLKELIVAAKVSENQLKGFFAKNLDRLSSLDFTLYLDAEIMNAEYGSSTEQILLTIKLNVLEARAKKLGVDVKAIAAIAAAPTDKDLLEQTKAHIADYNKDARELFLQSIRLNIDELQKRVKNVDPALIVNMKDMERVVMESL